MVLINESKSCGNLAVQDISSLIPLLQQQEQTIREQADMLQDEKEAGDKKDQTIERLTQEIALLREQITELIRKQYGRSKENLSDNVDGQIQLDLFGEPQITPPSSDPEEEITVPAHKRKKKGTKAMKLASLPQVEVHHECSESERECPDCGHEMTDMGTQKVRDEIAFHQATIETLQHIQHCYCCKHCEREGKTSIKKASVPRPIINNSLGSASLITETIRQKFEINLPAYRQIKYWEQLGLYISRENISNWH